MFKFSQDQTKNRKRKWNFKLRLNVQLPTFTHKKIPAKLVWTNGRKCWVNKRTRTFHLTAFLFHILGSVFVCVCYQFYYTRMLRTQRTLPLRRRESDGEVYIYCISIRNPRYATECIPNWVSTDMILNSKLLNTEGNNLLLLDCWKLTNERRKKRVCIVIATGWIEHFKFRAF